MADDTQLTPAPAPTPAGTTPAADPTAQTAQPQPVTPPPAQPSVPQIPEPSQNAVAAPVINALATPDPNQPIPQPQSTTVAPRGKERLLNVPVEQNPAVTTEATALATPETGAASGPTEAEPAKELEPEVEKAIERLENNKVPGPQETAVAAEKMPVTPPKTMAQPVVVLPLTEKKMNEAKNKSVRYSVHWLYQWCVRQIRKFKDMLVVYRE